jgi:hypothetical protein
MNMHRNWQRACLTSSVLSVVCASCAVTPESSVRNTQALEDGGENPADRSAWQVQQADQAVARTRQIIGAKETSYTEVAASVVTLTTDNTPHIGAQLVGRELWHVVLDGWTMEIESYPPHYKDRYLRTVDVYIDPLNGRVLKIKTQWPEGAPGKRPEVTAEVEEGKMARFGMKRIHGFADHDPKISFLQALDSIWRQGAGSPKNAMQIVGRYVMWSELDRPPRPVWAITLRGGLTSMSRRLREWGIPEEQHDHVVDALTGELITSGCTVSREAE